MADKLRNVSLAAVRWLDRRPFHAGVAAVVAGLAVAERPGLAALGAVVLGAACAGLRVPRLAAVLGLALLIGATVGAARLAAIDRQMHAARPGTSIAATATLLARPRRSRFGSSAELRFDSGRAAGTRVIARMSGQASWPGGGEPGMELHVAGALEAPSRKPGERLDWPAYLRRRGIGAQLVVDTIRATGRSRGGPSGAIDRMRRRGERALDAGMPREQAAVARGMVLGEDESIDPLLRDDYRRSGLAHVLAVSGQNVMLLCALALPLLGAAGVGPRGRVAVLLGLIAVYVPLAGAGPSLQRAGAMGAAGLVALAAGRPASRWYALLLAAAATLAVNPRIAGDPGWQLSFAAVVGILVLVPSLRRALRGLPGLLAEGAAVTLAATLATAPLLAHHFGAVSAVSLLANLAALPLVAPIMWLGMVQVALGVAGLDRPAAALGHVTALLVGWLDDLARYFAGLPGSRLAISLPTAATVIAAYVVIAAGVLVVRRLARRAEPRARSAAAAWRLGSPRQRAAAVALATAAIALGWTRFAGAPVPPSRLTVSFLDIGQGDATLVQDGAGAAVLFDGGPPEARVFRQLRGAGVRHLDLMVATHQSRDHQGGLHEVLERIPTSTLLENGDGTRDPDFNHLLAQARERRVRVVEPLQGELLHVGRLAIRVLGPPPRDPGPPPDDPNPRGLAAVVSEGDFDLFLSADAESDAILQYPLPPVEAMKVSHHGSADPGLPEVLGRLRPQVAAIEVGKDNTYGHPAPSTLAALRVHVPHVYRTDRDGTVR
ncbi:MAG: competence protein ComEC, partial [Thermoleophilaceae bacterium]|nr:competence protein ComEC [Thermoleophilaceae bacterium]